MRKIYLQLFLIIFGSSVIHAQLTESFNYSGALNANGWTTHSGVTPGQFQTLETASDQGNSLYYTNLENSQGNRTTFVAGNTEDVNKAITGISGTGYFSFLLKVTNTTGLTTIGDYFTGFGATSGSTVTIFAPRVFIKAGLTPNTFQLGIQNTTGGTPTQTYDPTEYAVGTTVFVVVKLNATASPIQASLFINPIPGSTEPAPTVINNSGTNTFTSFASIFLRQSGNATAGTGNLQVDEFRVGSTWESVTPEYTCNTTSTISPAACGTYTVPSGDEMYTESGIYFDTIPNAALCDSIITINLTINPLENTSDAETICDGESYQFGTQNLTTAGQYTETFQNMNGCDSTVTLTLSVVSELTYYQDLDGDGYGNASVSIVTCTPPADYVLVSGDCNDGDIYVNPAAPELCNGIDDNCNGFTDDNTGTLWYQDSDMDGFGNPAVTIMECIQPIGYTGNSMDCDDTNANINPDATDIPDNGIDEDCSGADASNPMIGIYEFTGVAACPNVSTAVTAQPTEATFSAYSSSNTGCVAAANVFNNDGWNTTSTIDLAEYNEFTLTANDCQEMTLSKLTFDHRNSGTGNAKWTVRSSVDNFAADIATGQSSSTIASQEVILGASFADLTVVTFRFYVTNAAAAGTTWRQDNVSLYGTFSAQTPQTFYADADNDGYGDINTSISVCTPPVGYVADNTDCDDTDADVNPLTVWYEDADGDLLGNSSNTFTGCVPPNNTYVLSGGDCDDADDTVGDPVGYYVDADNDGFGSVNATVSFLCTDPGAGYSTNNTDCDDAENTVYPGAPELCDGLDNDCNGQEDDGLTFVNYFLDADNDGFGDGTAINACESPGSNYVQVDGDCDDTDDTVYPGASEIMDDSIDQNCDGIDGYVGVDEISELIVNIAPNPSNGIVVISFNEFANALIAVTDLNGKICFESKIEGHSNSLDLSGLTNGVYTVKITSEFGFTQKRLIIQK